MALVLSEFDEASGIGRLKLNRPEVLNALDVPMARAFGAAVSELTSRPGLRAIVLSGEGRAFAAGGDVAGFVAVGIDSAPAVVDDLLDALVPAIMALRRHPAPVVSAVRGAAAGAGLALALLGDLIVAEEGAMFLVAYDRLGASPDCGLSWFLPRRVGRGIANQMMLTGRSMSASEALACGLADIVAAGPEFEERVRAVSGMVAAGPTRAFGEYKRLSDDDAALEAHLEAERRSFLACTRTADFAQGVEAFLVRRKATFSGR